MKYKKILLFFFLSLSTFLGCSAFRDPYKITRKIYINNKKNPIKIKKKVVSQSFFLTKEEVISSLAMLPPEIQTRIKYDLKAFLEDIEPILFQPPEFLWLIDKKNSIPNAQSYIPNDLINLNRYPEIPISKTDHQLREILIDDLIKMITDAREVGLNLTVSSAYRSYKYQINLFNRWEQELGLQKAKRISAKAGTSQHQLGTTLDFNSITKSFAKTKEGKWIFENGWKYGFSLSYPKGFEKLTGYDWEPWHWRYIGKDAAMIEKRWFNGIQQYFLLWWQKNQKIIHSSYIPIKKR